MRRRRASLLAGLLAVLVAVPAGVARVDAASEAGEYELKAAFLYNFAKFVEWPEEAFAASSTFCVGVVGADPFGRVLDDMLRDKTIHDREIEIRRFDHVAEAGRCHVLFVAPDRAAEAGRTPAGVLAVTDHPNGGVIGFAMEGNKLRFVINAVAAERAHLKMSSQLLKLALRVVKGPDS